MPDKSAAKKRKGIVEKRSATTAYHEGLKKMEDDELTVYYTYKADNLLEAARLFEEAGGYEDSRELAARCREKAAAVQKEGRSRVLRRIREREKIAVKDDEWESIQKDLEKLGDTPGAAEELSKVKALRGKKRRKSRTVRTVVLLILLAIVICIPIGVHSGLYRYLLGRMYAQADMYKMADAAFEKANGFADSEKRIRALRLEQLEKAEPGDDVPFGDYQWKVLAREEGTITLLASGLSSDSVFYGVPFDESGTDADWADSTLRAWLNGDFYSDSFADYEREHILSRDSAASSNEEYGTSWEGTENDYVTIPSAQEVSGYSEQIETLSGTWWLRTPGNTAGTACVMTSDHEILYYGYPADYGKIYVRPMIVIEDGWMEEEE